MRSLGTVSIESSPASSSPPFSFTKTAASSSPEADLFEEFSYSDDMDGDFRRIDTNTTAILGAGSAQENDLAVVNNNRADADPTPPPQKTWVVFHGKAPGVYDDWFGSLFYT
jgi:hypothetical protein